MKVAEIKPGVECWQHDDLAWTATSEPYPVPDEKDWFYVDIEWSAAQGGGSDYRTYHADEDLHFLRPPSEPESDEDETVEEGEE